MEYLENIYFSEIIISTVLILICGLYLLPVKCCKDEELTNYRISRIVLSVTYIFVSVCFLIGALVSHGKKSVQFGEVITLIAASFQALLFYFTLITLLNIHFVTYKKVIKHLFSIFFLADLLLIIYLKGRHSISFFSATYCLFFVLYIAQFSYYSGALIREYRNYKSQINHYFPDQEILRLRWIKRAFISSISITIMAILNLFTGIAFSILFIAVFSCFYILFAIKYAHYATGFQLIKSAIIANSKDN